MKVCWFHLMPYPYLPDDFKEKYRSVWIDVPSTLQEPKGTGGGSIETWNRVLERNYMYSYLSYFGYKHGQRVMQGFWDAVDRHGLARNPYRAGFLQLVAISDTDAKAEAEYAAHADYFYNRCLHIFEGFADAPGYRTQTTLRKGFRPQVGAQAMQRRQGMQWKDFIEQGYVIGGSPATVRDRLKAAMTDMNIGHLMVRCHFGNMPKDRTLQNTELFAKHVLPELQTMWRGWDDAWWPQSAPVPAQ